MRVLGLLTLFGITSSILISENVIFQTTNDISITHTNWLASFVIDLEPFNHFLIKLEKDIDTALMTADIILSKYGQPDKKEFRTTLFGLRKEVMYLNETRNSIYDGLLEYKLLPRHGKRAILEPLGDVIGYIFGFLTNRDMESIHRNIQNLAANQKQIIHVVQESISVLNMSRVEISKNRQTIMRLVSSVTWLDRKLENLVNESFRQIAENRYFMELYLKLDLVTFEIREMIQNSQVYLEHLKTQLNFLTLGHLTPTNIPPRKLLSLLLEIKDHLPVTFSLMCDPKTDLFKFYQNLQTSAVLLDKQIVIVLKIPLLEVNNRFQVIKAFNVPVIVNKDQTSNPQMTTMTATYRLESSGLLINQAKTKYALLSSDELARCSNPSINFCSVSSVIFPVNLAKLCIVNLFLQKSNEIQKYCESIIRVNTRLPFGLKLMGHMWAIISQTGLKFSIVCHNGNASTISTRPTIDIIHVSAGCIANSEYFCLTSEYDMKSEFQMKEDSLTFLRSISLEDINVLTPLEQKYPNFSKIEVPSHLNPVNEMSLKYLMSELDSPREIKLKDNHTWPTYAYFLLGFAVCLIAMLGIYMYRKYGRNICNTCSAISNFHEKSQKPKTGHVTQHGVAATATEQRTAHDKIDLSTPCNDEMSLDKIVFMGPSSTMEK